MWGSVRARPSRPGVAVTGAGPPGANSVALCPKHFGLRRSTVNSSAPMSGAAPCERGSPSMSTLLAAASLAPRSIVHEPAS